MKWLNSIFKESPQRRLAEANRSAKKIKGLSNLSLDEKTELLYKVLTILKYEGFSSQFRIGDDVISNLEGDLKLWSYPHALILDNRFRYSNIYKENRSIQDGFDCWEILSVDKPQSEIAIGFKRLDTVYIAINKYNQNVGFFKNLLGSVQLPESILDIGLANDDGFRESFLDIGDYREKTTDGGRILYLKSFEINEGKKILYVGKGGILATNDTDFSCKTEGIHKWYFLVINDPKNNVYSACKFSDSERNYPLFLYVDRTYIFEYALPEMIRLMERLNASIDTSHWRGGLVAGTDCHPSHINGALDYVTDYVRRELSKYGITLVGSSSTGVASFNPKKSELYGENTIILK